MQKFLPQISSSSSAIVVDKKQVIMVRAGPAKQWSEKWRAWLNTYDVSSLLAVVYESAGIFMNKATKQRSHAEEAQFAGRMTRAEQLLG